MRKLCYLLTAIFLTIAASGVHARSWRPMIFFEQDRPRGNDLGLHMTSVDKVIDDVMREAKEVRPGVIQVVGHTDFVESSDHVNLSMRRALAVKELLVKRGLASDKIFVFAKASTQPLVPTDGRVPEAQNRRVEIFFGRLLQ